MKGWIQELFLEPTFHFKYYGFDWITVPSPIVTYSLFGLMILSSFFVILGLFYRISIILFFILFTYFELIDLTNYLNHYYFVSLVAFLLIFVPANCNFSLDAKYGFCKRKQYVPSWSINILKFQLAIVYFYAGLAKLNYDWLIEANPLRIWLAPHTNLPVIGSFMDDPLTAYLFSWGGAIFDLTVPFLLLIKKTRLLGYLLVLIFHGLTSALFPIGVFPFVMMVSTLVFFSEDFHRKILQFFSGKEMIVQTKYQIKNTKIKWIILTFVAFQLVFPFRYLFYDNDLFWTEQGYRFSWRVMLVEKAGYASFKVFPYEDERSITIQNSDYLTLQQEKMMSTQPDFILQYAHFLGEQYQREYGREVQVKADVFVSVNGSPSQRFVKEDMDLMQIKNNLKPIHWLEEYN